LAAGVIRLIEQDSELESEKAPARGDEYGHACDASFGNECGSEQGKQRESVRGRKETGRKSGTESAEEAA
jgi:hypothetical protein